MAMPARRASGGIPRRWLPAGWSYLILSIRTTAARGGGGHGLRWEPSSRAPPVRPRSCSAAASFLPPPLRRPPSPPSSPPSPPPPPVGRPAWQADGWELRVRLKLLPPIHRRARHPGRRARRTMARHLGLLFALLAPAAFAAADAPEYVLELHDSPDVSLKDVIGVFKEKLGVSEAQSMPLVQRINEAGSSVVLMGPEVTCQKIAAFFEVHAALRHPRTPRGWQSVSQSVTTTLLAGST